MLVDTQPATHQHMPATPEVREEWVNSQLIGVLMDNAMPSLLAATLALPVMVFLMAGEVNPIALGIWTGALLLMLLYRYRLIGIYRLRYDSVGGAMRLSFVERYGWSWAMVGLFWGASIGLTFMQASVQTQFVSAVVVLGHGLLSLTSFSSYLQVFASTRLI